MRAVLPSNMRGMKVVISTSLEFRFALLGERADRFRKITRLHERRVPERGVVETLTHAGVRTLVHDAFDALHGEWRVGRDARRNGHRALQRGFRRVIDVIDEAKCRSFRGAEILARETELARRALSDDRRKTLQASHVLDDSHTHRAHGKCRLARAHAHVCRADYIDAGTDAPPGNARYDRLPARHERDDRALHRRELIQKASALRRHCGRCECVPKLRRHRNEVEPESEVAAGAAQHHGPDFGICIEIVEYTGRLTPEIGAERVALAWSFQ